MIGFISILIHIFSLKIFVLENTICLKKQKETKTVLFHSKIEIYQNAEENYIYIINWFLPKQIETSMIQTEMKNIPQQEHPLTPQSSQSKSISHSSRNFNKTKPIKKQKKVKEYRKDKSPPEKKKQVKKTSTNTMMPFSLFESEQQKYKRLEIYFREDIENYYRTNIPKEEIKQVFNKVGVNFVRLTQGLGKDSSIWPVHEIYEEEVVRYLELVDHCRRFNNQYNIVGNEDKKKYFCCFSKQNEYLVLEINRFEAQLLEKRKSFTRKLSTSNQNQPQLPSQLTEEVIFLFRSLYQFSLSVNDRLNKIQKKVEAQQKHNKSELITDEYSSYLLCKLLLDGFENKNIDYLNYFKNNQIRQHELEQKDVITDQREYDQFIKKKKSKKSKKGRYVLHTACLGCFSAISQQYNRFNYCQECTARFHKLCFRTRQDGLCENCYIKKMNLSYRVKANQCEICPIKGLLSAPTSENITIHHQKHIHIFCMLIHGQWKMESGRLLYQKNQSEITNTKCTICSTTAQFSVKCQECGQDAHGSCAFLAGWNFQGIITEKNKLILRVQCCGVPLQSNAKRRKFMLNYKKEAYSCPC